MRTRTIHHIYDDYNLYSLFYSRQLDVKAFEALNAIEAATDFYFQHLHLYSTPLRIMELFAGRSEHKTLFLSDIGVPVEHYDCLDNATHLLTHPAPGVVYGDALDLQSMKSTIPYNLYLAFFHSLNGPIDLNATKIDRATVIRHLKSVVKALKKSGEPGGYFLHIGNPGLGPIPEQIASLDDTDSELTRVRVPNSHPIRHAYSVQPTYRLFVEYTTSTEYRRVDSTMYTTFSKISVLSQSPTGRLTVLDTVTVHTPFLFRVWSENEMVDMMREAGFTQFKFYHNNKDSYTSNAERFELDEIVTCVNLSEQDLRDPEQMRAFTATEILAIV